MNSYSFPKTTPFDAVTGELLAEYRDFYLRGQLTPVPAQQVEAYVKSSAVQTSVLLGRYHELAELACQQGTPLAPPPRWVQQQLLHQPAVSGIGPLRRAVVRLALGLFGTLVLASGLQWARNEPLIPAPVVAAVTRTAAAATAATKELVQRFSAPPAPALALVRSVKRPAPVRTTAAPVKALPTRPATLPVLSVSDTLVTSVPPLAAPPLNNPAVAPPVVTSVVSGRISDERGRPLPGATVLVPGTQLVTSSNAGGEYSLEVPVDAMLQFGYGGCTDQVLRNPGGGVLNVILQAEVVAGKHHDRKHSKI